MNTTNLLGTSMLGTSLLLGGCWADSQTTIRQMQCHNRASLLPVEVAEIEKVIKEQIKEVCGGYHVINGMHPTGWNTGVNTTVIVTQSGKLFSLTRRVDGLLIPKPEEPKKPTETKELDTKYKIQ